MELNSIPKIYARGSQRFNATIFNGSVVLVREIQSDTLAEEVEWIKQQLFDAVKTDIHRGIVQGFAQYYKNILREGMTVFQNEITKPKETNQ